jgi:dolichyl-phosphate-mannose-protein mannosyltransferase
MKRKVLIIGMFLLLGIGMFSYISFGSVNLVKNSSFEEVTNLKANDWQPAVWNKKVGVSELKIKLGFAHTGNKSLNIINKSINDARLKQTVKVKANTIYRLSCWIKTENVGEHNKGANISIEGELKSSKDIRGTNSKWEYSEMYAKTSNETSELNVTVGLGGYSSVNTGTAYFDDVIVEEVGSIPPGAVVSYLVNDKQKSTSDSESTSSNYKSLLIILAIAAAFVILGSIIYYLYTNKKTKEVLDNSDLIKLQDNLNKDTFEKNTEVKDNSDESNISDDDLI